MIISPIKTDIIKPSQVSILDIIDKFLPVLNEGTVIAISSKIVSLCEGSVADPDQVPKDKLIKQNAQLYLDRNLSKFGTMLTITKNTLMLAAGIDESNSAGMYVFWPKNPLATAKQVYDHLIAKNNIKNLGIVICDSTSKPMRLGTVGVSLAHYGFKEINDYRGKQDLFGKTMEVTRANIAEGLATSAVLAMGEGIEQTPIALISDVSFAVFGNEHFGSSYNAVEDYREDVYEPILSSPKWHTGDDKI
ncbi:MAG: coenzyme F420-0:L-glutamate ligase [bacterium]